MNVLQTPVFRRGIAHGQHLRWTRSILCLVTLLIVLPALAEAQFINSPFDTGLTSLQSLFTSTVAKVASLIAIVIGGYQFAHGEPGAKKGQNQHFVAFSQVFFELRITLKTAVAK